ncbi:hypothetical protein K435DRAFT_851141 [Dendrothele bispora CBS 962.96]|uniref:Uncharacterized protein n=1 Tax=Dendrothele bispora (strain CBS 962.96) TaxID=1314807 RepID=A0A4V4HHV3_DENBC|nr:hypothetical protein K435DRAFT_851141 [Dendrothele bispora CBS 962.96]
MIFPNTTTLFIPLRSPNHSTTSYHTRPSNETSPARYHHSVTEQYRSLQVPPRLHASSSSSSSTTTPRNDTGSNHTPFKRLETMTTSSDYRSKSPVSNLPFSITTATTVKSEFNDQQLFVSPSLALPIEVPLRATQVATEMRSTMHSLRLNPFTFHLEATNNDSSALTWSGEEAKPLEEKPLVFEWQIEGYQSGIVDEDELFVIPSEEEDEEEMVEQKSRQVHSIEEDENCCSMFMDPSPLSSVSSMFSGSTSLTNPSIVNTSRLFDSELEQCPGDHHHNLTDNGTRRTVALRNTESVHSNGGTAGTTGTGQTYYHEEDSYSMRRSILSSSESRSLALTGHGNAESEGGYEYEFEDEVESEERGTFKLHYINDFGNSPVGAMVTISSLGPVSSGESLHVYDNHHGNGCRASPDEGRISDNSPFPIHPRAPTPQEEILGIPDSELSSSSSSSSSYPTEINTSNNHTCEVRWFLFNSKSSSSNGYCAPAETLHRHRHNPSQNAFKPPFSASVPISQPSNYSGPGLNIISQQEEEEEGLIKIISTTSITVNNKATTVSSIPGPGLVPILTGDPGFNITAGHVTLALLVES